MKYLSLLLALALLSCTASPVDPSSRVVPGVGSSYVSTRTTTSSDPAVPARFDTLRLSVEAFLPSFQGEMNVVQIAAAGGGILYHAYEENGNLVTRERSPFPIADTWVEGPVWITWPYSGNVIDRVLLDSSNAFGRGLDLKATYRAERLGTGSMRVDGEEFQGVRVSYRFTYSIVQDDLTRIVEGTSLFLPAIGWRGEIDEVTTTVVASDTIMTTTRKERLVDYVLTPTP